MMERNRLKLGLGTMAACITAWLFVGFDRFVGDHETGTFWEPFLKRRPSLQVTFRNPAQSGLEMMPPDSLDARTQAEFRAYCGIRYGLDDIGTCFRTISAERL